MNTLDVISSYGIEIDSWIQAISTVSNEGDLGEFAYRERITEMCNHGTSHLPIEQLHLVYGYIIQEAIRTDLSGQELFSFAVDQAAQFANSNSYIFAVKEAEERISERDGKVKPKKGAKGQLAEAAYKANMGKGLKRGEMMKILMEEAEMSKGGASTYYANYKKQYGP